MCCDQCQQPIQPGTERPAWIESLQRVGQVCALCFPFVASMVFGQTSPQQRPAPLLVNFASTIIAPNTNTASAMMTYSIDVGRNHKP